MNSCIVCSKKLTGYRIKYCSINCYWKLRKPWEKDHYRKYNPYLPNRDCIWCGKSFRPRGEVHVCCDRKCRTELELQKAKEKRKETPTDMSGWGDAGWVIRLNRPEPTLTEEPMSLHNSNHKTEIKEYLADGGKIKSLPDQLNGRTPTVCVPDLLSLHLPGWSVTTLYGFGYEIRLMDELLSTSEVDDAN
jgi:hypothetical protein